MHEPVDEDHRQDAGHPPRERVRAADPDTPDPDQLTQLRSSVANFDLAVAGSVEELRARPMGLRASGTVVTGNPIFVSNAHADGKPAETVESQ